ncbi:tetratricopeptide repeat protein [Cellvibrio japonicus]|uniref:TPR domain protein n=1 Tax=Cellvibrio japonicus (strain Ueda107) TaxID=498211 RepID=B3PFA5_CELJU|nr:tetratricopeptide repeat protein [Cellvibrio japonicus]ACE85254.1 TPR domain protein [Cellvibrio japonicus Ueda107]QEI13654.1 tetratricopeptide repeat protein [Cellvibrio japonicus]QEI17227.1 tetratricopeptide repeat protein [Cellvibrio japonicus]QEI20805.1 tetratricopeptide repeat protein [Cellvibrio japonicus]
MKRYVYLLVITLVISLTGCSDKKQEQREQADRHIKSASTYISQGQLRAAVLEAQNVVRLQPERADGYLLLGRIYGQIGAYATSQQMLSKVVSKFPEVSTELAEAYLHTKKYRSVIDTINNYPASTPENKQRQAIAKAIANTYLGDRAGYDAALQELINVGGVETQQAKIRATYVLAQGKPEEAQAILEAVLPQAQEDTELLELLGSIYLYSQKLPQAESQLTKVLGLLPKTDVLSVQRARVLSQLIDTLIQQGRTSEAYTYQKVLAEANPESNAAQQRFNQALELYQQNKLEEAEAILAELREQFPNDKNTATLLGMIEFQQGDDERAANLFDEYIDPETAASSLLQMAALVKYRSNKMEDAVEMLKKASESQPNNPDILATYGLALLDRDEKSAEGAMALEKSLALNPRQQRIRIALAKRYMALGQPEQAIGQLQKAYQEQPLDLVIQQSYLKSLFDNDEIKRVRDEINSFIQRYPDNARGPFLEGWYAVEQKDYVAAEKAFERALSMPQNSEKQLAYSGLAQLYELQKNPQKAVVAWQNTIAANPAATAPYRPWLRHIVSLNRLSQAELFLKELAQTSKAWQPSLVLAELMARSGRLDDALVYAENAMTDSNQARQVGARLADLYQAKATNLRIANQLPEARAYFLKAINLYPDSPGYLAGLIETEIAANNIPEAQKLLDQFVKTEDNMAVRYYLQGVIHLADKKSDEALKQFRLSWEVKPTETTANAIAGFYQQHNQQAELSRFLDEWANKLPNSQRMAVMKAMAAQAKNNQQEAIQWYEKALELSPNIPLVLNNLAWLYYETGDKRAVELASKAAQLAPNSAAVLDTYGWVLVETGSVNQGIDVLQKAVDIEPDNAEIKAHLEQAKIKAAP